MNDIPEAAGLRDYPLARRGLMMTSLISGFTLAVDRVEAQTITTDTNGLDAGDTKIPTTDGDLPPTTPRPAKGTHFPIVIVNEEIFGVHEHIKDLCRRLAKVGIPRRGDRVLRAHRRSVENDRHSDDHQRRHLQSPRCPIPLRRRLHHQLGRQRNKGDLRHVAVTGFCRGGPPDLADRVRQPRVKRRWRGTVRWPARPPTFSRRPCWTSPTN